MATPAIIAVLRHIRRMSGGAADGQPGDRQLLEDFAGSRDEAAFAALVSRHGPMVLSVCRGVLGDAHAAEDAFQATFLVLARKAGSIRHRKSAGGWLCQVARRVALRARARAADRLERERGAVAMSSAEPWLDLSLRELRSAVHEEVGRLPEKYRTPVVLCHLEGKTQEEAARLLGVSGGAIKGRLERGRQRLRVRLSRRGLALPAGLFAAALAKAAEVVPERLVQTVLRTALAAGPGLAGVSVEVLDLAREATITMASKLKIATVFLIAALGVGGTIGYPALTARDGEAPAPKAAAPAQPAPVAAKPAVQGETLHYDCKVTDKDTGKPIAGATVVVHRWVQDDPGEKESYRNIAKTKHATDSDGRFSFSVSVEQMAERDLYIGVAVRHPDYIPDDGEGFTLGRILELIKNGDRPPFDHVRLKRGAPVTGTVQTPDGRPAAGMSVKAYSNVEHAPNEQPHFGSFTQTRTDAMGRFRLMLNTKGFAAVWLQPKEYAPSTYVLKDNKRGDLGTLTVVPGIRLHGRVLDAKGQPVAGVIVSACPKERNEAITEPITDQVIRSAVADGQGKFAMNPLPPGLYMVAPSERSMDGSWDQAEPARREPVPLPGVFLGTTVKLSDGEEPEAVEIRGSPTVVVQVQYVNSKGQPLRRRHRGTINGELDNVSWFREFETDRDGQLVVHAPHGLEDGFLDQIHHDEEALRWRKSKNEPLSNAAWITLGTLTDDVKGIEIVIYKAPILLVKVMAKGGGIKPLDIAVTADYAPERGPYPSKLFVPGGLGSDVSFEKQNDGRFRSSQLLPDEEVTVAAHAEGYSCTPVKIKLPEGATKEIEIALEKTPANREDHKKDEKP